MDNLPINSSSRLSEQLYAKIFEQLDVRDRATVSAACRRFKRICDLIDQSDLAICNGHSTENTWFISNDLVTQRDTLHNVDLGYTFRFPGWARNQLKRLKFCEVDVNFFFLKKLQFQLRALECLEFKELKGQKVRLQINLPCLRTLFIGSSTTTEVSLLFDCPKLQAIHYGPGAVQTISLTRPSSIQHLEIYDYIAKELLVKMSNVKVIHVDYVCNLRNEVVNVIIRSLPKLSKLHCEIGCSNGTDKQPLPGELAKLREMVGHILREEPAFKLYVRGVQVVKDVPFDSYQFDKDLLTLHQHHSKQLAYRRFPQMTALIYNDLADMYGERLPLSFFDRYPNVRTVTVSFDKVDQDEFITFLRYCRKLTSLILVETQLTQAFYQEISRWPLSELEIIENKKNIHFDFLANMTSLHQFKTNKKIRPLLVLSLFERRGGCEMRFEFRLYDCSVFITKMAKDRFELRCKSARIDLVEKHIAFSQLASLVQDIASNGLASVSQSVGAKGKRYQPITAPRPSTSSIDIPRRSIDKSSWHPKRGSVDRDSGKESDSDLRSPTKKSCSERIRWVSYYNFE